MSLTCVPNHDGDRPPRGVERGPVGRRVDSARKSGQHRHTCGRKLAREPRGLRDPLCRSLTRPHNGNRSVVRLSKLSTHHQERRPVVDLAKIRWIGLVEDREHRDAAVPKLVGETLEALEPLRRGSRREPLGFNQIERRGVPSPVDESESATGLLDQRGSAGPLAPLAGRGNEGEDCGGLSGRTRHGHEHMFESTAPV